jgi:hypothetical protein
MRRNVIKWQAEKFENLNAGSLFNCRQLEVSFEFLQMTMKNG